MFFKDNHIGDALNYFYNGNENDLLRILFPNNIYDIEYGRLNIEFVNLTKKISKMSYEINDNILLKYILKSINSNTILPMEELIEKWKTDGIVAGEIYLAGAYLYNNDIDIMKLLGVNKSYNKSLVKKVLMIAKGLFYASVDIKGDEIKYLNDRNRTLKEKILKK